MLFEDTLAELGRATGLGDLALDENESCSLLFDGELELTFVRDREDDAVFLYGLAGNSMTLRDAETCRSLLAASLLGAETGGAAFALRGNSVILWKRYSGFEDYFALEKALNGFLAQLAQWRKRLDGLPESGGGGGNVTSSILENMILV
jgi:hypothetical protein